MQLRRQTLSEQVYDVLKEDILSQRIAPGEKLVNRDLQQRFGVSSTPVRDAVNHLYLDGLVGEFTNAGARVIRFDLQFTQQVNEMVSILCCAALERCAARADIAAVAKILRGVLALQETCADAEYVRLDDSFHHIFFEHCGNTHLLDSYNRYHVLWETLVRRFHEFVSARQASVDQHRQIVDAFADGNTPRAVERMHQHFEVAAALFRRNME